MHSASIASSGRFRFAFRGRVSKWVPRFSSYSTPLRSSSISFSGSTRIDMNTDSIGSVRESYLAALARPRSYPSIARTLLNILYATPSCNAFSRHWVLRALYSVTQIRVLHEIHQPPAGSCYPLLRGVQISVLAAFLLITPARTGTRRNSQHQGSQSSSRVLISRVTFWTWTFFTF